MMRILAVLLSTGPLVASTREDDERRVMYPSIKLSMNRRTATVPAPAFTFSMTVQAWAPKGTIITQMLTPIRSSTR